MENTGYILRLENISKNFGEGDILKKMNLEVKRGEFMTFLGSSGCGKTTTIRIIAGLEAPDEGKVILEGVDVTNLPPNKRDVNTVFQNYALFPHMTVAENIAYGRKIRKIPKETIKKEVEEMLNLVQLTGFEDRYPSELSGGQMQRVAIARAIINHPKVLLLDEPLGALDLRLRRQMQVELKRIQKKVGITFIYITHDQEEAINMSDRILVMREGIIEQIGTPDQIYNHPETAYVAEFVGSANVFPEGEAVAIQEGMSLLKIAGGTVSVDEELPLGSRHTVAVRRENLKLCPEEGCKGLKLGAEGILCEVIDASFSAGMVDVYLKLKNGEKDDIVGRLRGIHVNHNPGDLVRVSWDPEDAMLVNRKRGGDP